MFVLDLDDELEWPRFSTTVRGRQLRKNVTDTLTHNLVVILRLPGGEFFDTK